MEKFQPMKDFRLFYWISVGLLLTFASSCSITKSTILITPLVTTTEATATISRSPTPVPTQNVSRALFQVFILNPVQTCIAGNDFYSGNACYGSNCGDCNCTNQEFDPPAPLTGIAPEHIGDPQYANYKHKVCFNIELSDAEIKKITNDMNEIHDLVLQWSNGSLDLVMDIHVLPYTHTGFVAPDFAFGPFEVDDELLNQYVTTDTDFIYVVTGQKDPAQGKYLAGWCGGSYGEMHIHGAGYSYVQYNEGCASVVVGGHSIYEPLLHEWYHNLEWDLYNINQVNDIYQFKYPDWANWKRASWPACNNGDQNPLLWFPSVDYCEWDPDWIDCNDIQSAGLCKHASESLENMSWYEHLIRAHYPQQISFNGNSCADKRMDWGETAIDFGGSCP